MIKRETIKQVLLDYRREVERQQVVRRECEIGSLRCVVLVGVRRAGKSFLLYQQMQSNLRSGITWDEMLYLNFEDERLIGMTASELNLILEVHGSLSPLRPTLFLDEPQVVEGWEKFARRLADTGYSVYITGSNARMLSSDVATTLGGRYVVRHVLPYSFREYLSARGQGYDAPTLGETLGAAAIRRHFDEYLHYGGFPEGVALPAKRDYLASVYQKIYLGDIAARHNISGTFTLRLLFRKIAESIRQPVSFTRLTSIIASTGAKVGKATVINYMEYSREAFLVLPVKNIADSLTERETCPKYYFVDNGIVSLLDPSADTSLLENLVAVELLRRHGFDERVFFYNHNVEVDFYLPDEGTAIQVSYAPHKSEATWQRETSALVRLSKRLSCRRALLLTYDDEGEATVGDCRITLLPVWRWLLE